MITFLYDILINPISWIMQLILNLMYDSLNSYGMAIIVLSIVINIILFPIYHIAERWQKEERFLRNKMALMKRDINKAFKGQERFMMLQTLYRQTGYHPMMAVRNSIGFLIQIPFFFAAYAFLSHYSPLKGQGFLFITDLSQPDRLCMLGNIPINILPLVMTAINLLSAQVYTNNLAFRDKIQLYVFAGLFLIILYVAPSGLVLYWTLNNICSLIKNILYKLTASPTKAAIGTKKKHSLMTISMLTLVSLVTFCYSLIIYNTLIVDIINNHLFKILAITFSILFIIIVLKYIKFPKLTFKSLINPQKLFYLSLTTSLIIIFIYQPLSTYASDFQILQISLKEILSVGITFVFWLLFMAFIGQGFLSLQQKKYATFISLFVSCLVIINTSINFLKLGPLNLYLFEGANFFSLLTGCIIDFSLGILIFLFLYIALKKIAIAFFEFLFLTLLIAFLGGSYYQYSHINSLVNKRMSNTNPLSLPSTTSAKGFLPEYTDTLLSFSKDKKNILVLMLDTFTGQHANLIFERYPKLRQKFSGFIWYPNTVSSGDNTYLGSPSIIGGPNFTAEAINGRSEQMLSLADEYNKSYYSVSENFGNQNDYALVFAGTQYTDCKTLSHYSKNISLCEDLSYEQEFLEYQFNIDENVIKRANQRLFLIVHSLFYAAPYSMKKRIYSDGAWLGAVGQANRENEYIEQYAPLLSFPQNSNSNSEKPTFKYIQSNFTHFPFILEENCLDFRINPRLATPLNIEGVYEDAFISEVCALKTISTWIDWMKLAGIYDNTMIVLVSDHGGRHLPHPSVILQESQSTSEADYGKFDSASSLLMVKDFNTKGMAKKSMRLMSNSDVLSIVCSAIDGCFEQYQDARFLNTKRTLTHSVAIASFPGAHKKNAFVITEQYRIKDNMYQKENWERIK